MCTGLVSIMHNLLRINSHAFNSASLLDISNSTTSMWLPYKLMHSLEFWWTSGWWTICEYINHSNKMNLYQKQSVNYTYRCTDMLQNFHHWPETEIFHSVCIFGQKIRTLPSQSMECIHQAFHIWKLKARLLLVGFLCITIRWQRHILLQKGMQSKERALKK